MKLSKKTMTHLLDADFRKRVLDTYCKHDRQLDTYVKSVVDELVKTRDLTALHDKSKLYGFQPLMVVSAVKEDLTVVHNLIESKILCHIIRDSDMQGAYDALKAIMSIWKSEDRTIVSFDCDKITESLKALERSNNVEEAPLKTEDCDRHELSAV